jgi:hypothetical protein
MPKKSGRPLANLLRLVLDIPFSNGYGGGRLVLRKAQRRFAYHVTRDYRHKRN